MKQIHLDMLLVMSRSFIAQWMEDNKDFKKNYGEVLELYKIITTQMISNLGKLHLELKIKNIVTSYMDSLNKLTMKEQDDKGNVQANLLALGSQLVALIVEHNAIKGITIKSMQRLCNDIDKKLSRDISNKTLFNSYKIAHLVDRELILKDK